MNPPLPNGDRSAPVTAGALQRGYVGSFLDVVPAISAPGLFIRISRLNLLSHLDYRAMVCRWDGRRSDIIPLLTYSPTGQQGLAKALMLPTVPDTWRPATWYPFAVRHQVLELDCGLRYCPECVRMGYHTVLHQLPWITTCPWHAERLLHGCTKCGAALRVTIFHWARGQAPLRCTCGHDHLDIEIALTYSPDTSKDANRYLDAYLAWAARERTQSTMVVGTTTALSQRVSSTVLLPQPLGAAFTHPGPDFCTPRIFRQRPKRVSAAEVHAALMQLGKLTCARSDALRVPDGMRRLVTAVTRQVARRHAYDPDVLALLCRASLTATEIPEDQNYISLGCIPATVCNAIIELINEVCGPVGSSSLDESEGALLLRATRHLLCRGYADGLRIMLAKVGAPPLAPLSESFPCLQVRRLDGKVVVIQVTWQPAMG